MADRSNKELELIIRRLETQLESKNEQIAELNEFIRTATDNTQELIKNFRAFCIRVLESELAYGDITSRDLEAMSLNDLLSRARNMLRQNQEKARSIYDTFKERLTQKNQMIQGLTDQVSQLKIMLDNAEKMFTTPFEEPQDMKRTAVYMLDTDTPLEALRPAIATTTIAGENERVVDLTENGDGELPSLITKGKMYVQDLDNITGQMKEVHWEALRLIVESGVSELSVARKLLIEKLTDENEPVSTDKSFRILKQLVTLMIFTQIKVSTGMRWFMVLNLTDIGTRLYMERYRKPPAETEYQRIVREHENAEHGYIIKDVCQILRDTGRYRSVSMSRRGNTIQLPEGRSCIPDIVCCLPNGIEYYEVECGNHHQSDFSEKCNKLKGITQNLFFVTPNRETTEKKLKPQIEQWIKECGRSLLAMSGITVYLTSISELAAQRWTYVFDMKKEEPIYTAAPAAKKK